MDPLTAALNLANSLVALESKVWDKVPPDLQTTLAGDAAKFCHNIGSFFIGLQDKLNALVVPPAPPSK
jgi:hypothetical protein